MAIRVEDIDLAADRELVERWQAGEQGAFDDLYRRYFTRLRSFCQKRVHDRDAAEEIAQEAFVKALQALPRFAGERRFYPWVTVIASRLCVDHHRRLARVQPVEDLDPGVVDGDPGVRLAFLADVDNLDRALRRLGPRHHQVLELREREGLTYAEIADRLEVPQTTVEALLFRARKALRREFLAVSGEGRLASVPLVGALVRRLAAMRDRAAGLMPSLSQLAGPVAAGAAAAVLAAAPFAPAPQASHRPARAAAIAHVASTSAAPPSIDSAAPSSATGAAPHANVSPRGTKAVPGVQKMSSGEARRNASSMPVLLDIGGAGAGADPNAPVTWVTSYLSGGGR